MTTDEIYMHRCIELARLGQGNVAPNPMVGSVLVYRDRIIGEGYHKKYGEAHAEVNCIQSVKPEDQHFIEQSIIYVSLEPCAHFGKTPPCADLIIKHRIPKVVVGCRDPFELVAGKGIEKLQSAGIEVTSGVLEKECKELNKRFFTFHIQRRPYIVLKWAQTGDGKIARHTAFPKPIQGSINAQYSHLNTFNEEVGAGSSSLGGSSDRLLISNEYTNRLVHKWRSEEMSILVGTNTALLDDPELNTRLWPGQSPIRLVIDLNLELPSTLKLFNGKYQTIVFNTIKHTLPDEGMKLSFSDGSGHPVFYYQVTEDVSFIHQLSNALYHLKIQSVLVEGGAFMLQSFIDEDMWDEAKVITNEELFIGSGLPAPSLKDHYLQNRTHILSDTIRTYYHQQHP